MGTPTTTQSASNCNSRSPFLAMTRLICRARASTSRRTTVVPVKASAPAAGTSFKRLYDLPSAPGWMRERETSIDLRTRILVGRRLKSAQVTEALYGPWPSNRRDTSRRNTCELLQVAVHEKFVVRTAISEEVELLQRGRMARAGVQLVHQIVEDNAAHLARSSFCEGAPSATMTFHKFGLGRANPLGVCADEGLVLRDRTKVPEPPGNANTIPFDRDLG